MMHSSWQQGSDNMDRFIIIKIGIIGGIIPLILLLTLILMDLIQGTLYQIRLNLD